MRQINHNFCICINFGKSCACEYCFKSTGTTTRCSNFGLLQIIELDLRIDVTRVPREKKALSLALLLQRGHLLPDFDLFYM